MSGSTPLTTRSKSQGRSNGFGLDECRAVSPAGSAGVIGRQGRLPLASQNVQIVNGITNCIRTPGRAYRAKRQSDILPPSSRPSGTMADKPDEPFRQAQAPSPSWGRGSSGTTRPTHGPALEVAKPRGNWEHAAGNKSTAPGNFRRALPSVPSSLPASYSPIAAEPGYFTLSSQPKPHPVPNLFPHSWLLRRSGLRQPRQVGVVSARRTDQAPDPRGLRVVEHRQNIVARVKNAG